MAMPTSLASIALFLGFAYGFAIAVGLVVFVNGGDSVHTSHEEFQRTLGSILFHRIRD